MSYRKLKKSWKKWSDERPLTTRERGLIRGAIDGCFPMGEKITRDGPLRIVGKWIDDLIWCPSQCYLRIIHRHRWFIIYLRWRHSDPWSAELVETSVGNVDPYNAPGWDMHDPGYEWRTIPVDDFRDDQLDELKAAVMVEVKRLLLHV